MARPGGFGRTLVFGALAAVALPATLVLGAPLFGVAATLRGFVVAIAVAYVLVLARDVTGRVAAVAAAAALAGILLLLPLGLAATAVGAAGLVALCRSGLLHRGGVLRALAVEGGLAAAALAVAGLLAGRGAVSLALAVWGFFVVQSAFFLVGRGEAGRADAAPDPFEQARARLLRLLGDAPGATR